MAILNLAGNFQPPPAATGKVLPSSSARAPSSSNNLDQSEFAANGVGNSATKVAENAKAVALSNQQKSTVVKQEVKNQIEALQEYNQNIDRSLQFSVDEELGVTIVRVVDKQTDELIRQFPPEELINLSRRLKELNDQNTEQKGVLLQEKV